MAVVLTLGFFLLGGCAQQQSPTKMHKQNQQQVKDEGPAL